MSALRPEGSVGHEWEADQRIRCGSAPGVVNMADHLWRVGLGPGVGSTRVVFLRYARPPCMVPPRPTLCSVPWGSSGGGFFQGGLYLFPPTNQRAPVAGSLFPSMLAD
jgi:hypothetical protein